MSAEKCPDCESETHFCRVHQKKQIALEKKGYNAFEINMMIGE